MKKFEYKRVYREVGYRELDMIGEAGWELVAVVPMAYADFFPEPLRNEFDIAMYVKKYIDDPDGYDGIAFSRYLADLKRTGKYIDWEEMI